MNFKLLSSAAMNRRKVRSCLKLLSSEAQYHQCLPFSTPRLNSKLVSENAFITWLLAPYGHVVLSSSQALPEFSPNLTRVGMHIEVTFYSSLPVARAHPPMRPIFGPPQAHIVQLPHKMSIYLLENTIFSCPYSFSMQYIFHLVSLSIVSRIFFPRGCQDHKLVTNCHRSTFTNGIRGVNPKVVVTVFS